jgi:hypothetical protein
MKMIRKKGFALCVIMSLFVVFGINLGLAQEQDPVLAQEGALSSDSQENGTQGQWLWGEVLGIDAQNRTISVKYLDYETDQEKEIVISVDEKTNYENINSLEDLKAMDTVSIDYVVSAEGKNIVQNIGVEKPEAIEEAPEDILTADQLGADPQAVSPSQEIADIP